MGRMKYEGDARFGDAFAEDFEQWDLAAENGGEPFTQDRNADVPEALRPLIGKRFPIVLEEDDTAVPKSLCTPEPPTTSRTARWLAKLRAPATADDVHRATNTLDLIGDIVPPSVSDGEIGDALERIDQLRCAGASRARIRIVVWRTVAWSVVNAIREVVRAFTGKAKRKGAE